MNNSQQPISSNGLQDPYISDNDEDTLIAGQPEKQPDDVVFKGVNYGAPMSNKAVLAVLQRKIPASKVPGAANILEASQRSLDDNYTEGALPGSGYNKNQYNQSNTLIFN